MLSFFRRSELRAPACDRLDQASVLALRLGVAQSGGDMVLGVSGGLESSSGSGQLKNLERWNDNSRAWHTSLS